MAETLHGRLVRCRRTSQIHPRKPPQRRRFIERVFHTRVRQVEPLLKKVNPQHDRQTYGLAAITCPGIMRLDQRFQFPPRNDSFHRLQKLFPLTLPPVLLEAALGRQCNLSHRAPYPLTTLLNSAVDLGLVQRFPNCSRVARSSGGTMVLKIGSYGTRFLRLTLGPSSKLISTSVILPPATLSRVPI